MSSQTNVTKDGPLLFGTLLLAPFPVIYCWFEAIVIWRQPANYSLLDYLTFFLTSLWAIGCVGVVLYLMGKHRKTILVVLRQVAIAILQGMLVGVAAEVLFLIVTQGVYYDGFVGVFSCFWALGTLAFLPVRLKTVGVWDERSFLQEKQQ
jgi:hypothetical protein